MLENIKLASINCGIKYKNRNDLLLISFCSAVNVAGVFTNSSMPAYPVVWCKQNLTKKIAQKTARALIVNAGNANAFTGKQGEEVVKSTAQAVATQLNCHLEEVFVASTGVIGEQLNQQLIIDALPSLCNNLSNTQQAWQEASLAILTTDTKPKLITKFCDIEGKNISIIGFAKGSGMIAPNMATMLAFIFTDANICSNTLQQLLQEANENSFNAITVDSDQSTNDTVLLFATKTAKHHEINDSHNSHLHSFRQALGELMLDLAKLIVVDGEGAKKLIEISVEGASNKIQAKQVAMAIANSPLVKTAIAGADPNWGRIVMAVGKSCQEASPETLLVKIGDHPLTLQGAKHPDYVEKLVHQYLTGNEVKITVNLGLGYASFVAWTCDLNEEYIKINKDYRS